MVYAEPGYYNPDTATLNAFERAKSKVQFVVFGGTWCEDTQFIIALSFLRYRRRAGSRMKPLLFCGEPGQKTL